MEMLAGVRVVVRDNGRFEADAHGQPVQYAVCRDGESMTLCTVSRAEWIDDPVVMDVNTLTGAGSRI